MFTPPQSRSGNIKLAWAIMSDAYFDILKGKP